MNPIKTIGIFTYVTKKAYRAKLDPSATEDFSDMDSEIRGAGYIGLVSQQILGPLGLSWGLSQSPLSAEDVGYRLYPHSTEPDYEKLLIPVGTVVYVMKALENSPT